MGDRRGTLLDDYLAIAEENRARTALRLSKATAELRDIRVGIDDVTFDRLHTRLVVSTVVECHPKTLELRGPTDLRPSDPIRHFFR